MKSPLGLFLTEIYLTKLKNNQSTINCRIQSNIFIVLKDKDEKVTLFNRVINIHSSITFNFDEKHKVTSYHWVLCGLIG